MRKKHQKQVVRNLEIGIAFGKNYPEKVFLEKLGDKKDSKK